MERVGIPRYARSAQKSVQRAATAATGIKAGVSPGEHDGNICDVKPDGTTVHGATDDDACAHTDANDAPAANAAVADDGATTADDGTNGTLVSNDTVAAIGRAANAAVRLATVLRWFWNGITHGEEPLTLRGGRAGSFKH